jgi:hypothetical protein
VFDKNLNVLKWNLNVKIKNTIADYRFKSSMFGQNDWSMISGRTLRPWLKSVNKKLPGVLGNNIGTYPKD